MRDPSKARPRSDTDRTNSELARGRAERFILGSNPYGSMMRLVLGIVLFIAVFGTIFFFVRR